MAELNLKQIVDKLNTEFTGEHCKLVFWYDEAADFADDIDSIELENAKIYKLTKDNQFYTKYFLERMDKTTNYLIYAPFPKPNVRDNHLEDTLLYSMCMFQAILGVSEYLYCLRELELMHDGKFLLWFRKEQIGRRR